MTEGGAATRVAARTGGDVEELRATLREKTQQLDLIEESLDGIWDWNMKTGALYLSPAWTRTLGYDDGELPPVVSTWESLLMPGEVERAYAAVAAHCERGEPYEQVLKYRRKDGSTAHVLARGKAVRDSDGNWARMVGTHTDLTDAEEHRHALDGEVEQRNAELAKQAAMLRAILDSLATGVIVANADGEFTHYNAAAAAVTGLEHTVLPQEEWADRYGTFERDGSTPVPTEDLPLSRALKGEVVEGRELALRNPSLPDMRWIQTSARPLPDTVPGAVVVFTDVTELAHARRELERSNTELEQFAYVASHDLQEPLRKVRGFVELLADEVDGQLTPEGQKYMSFVRDGARRMQTLVQDLLKFSRIQRGDAPAESVDMSEVLAAVQDDLDGAIAEAGASVTSGPLPTVPGRRVQLQQLMQNLIGNAIKFRGDRPPSVQVDAGTEGARFRFSVADNGIGIEPSHRERVFQIFQRLHGRGAYPGTGIGLALRRRIVDLHGGKIWIEGNAAGGATFVFTLPA